MDIMYDFMKRANVGENKREKTYFIKVTDSSVSECEGKLAQAQKGLGNETTIKFRTALKDLTRVTSELSTGVHYIVYKKRKIASWPSSQAGHITKLAFFLYDTADEVLFFCGFLRTRLKHDTWECSHKGPVQTGISIVQANETSSYAKTCGV
ncbi:hypothetical protein QX776_07410 [Alteromonadaceae bacterium BrNp21-10]|nr:hypothetical protein [Alteromonadaceae bacterium BrNp21-10]